MVNSIEVQWQATPNPATLKFLTNLKLVDEPKDFTTALEAETSPLAAKIFGFPWTNSVFIGTDFITVTKQDWVDWEVLAEPLAGLLREHFQNGEPIMSESIASEANENDSPEVKLIKDIIQREIRPAVALDGGDIVFAKYENQVVYLHMRGSCAGCPSSVQTLKQGIETRLQEALPEIKEVVSI